MSGFTCKKKNVELHATLGCNQMVLFNVFLRGGQWRKSPQLYPQTRKQTESLPSEPDWAGESPEVGN